jgi:hypothetical protein
MTPASTGLLGSLRSLHLLAIVRFLSELEKTGRLSVAHGRWRGEVGLERGALVGARLSSDAGRSAFEGMAVGLPDGKFVFRDEPPGQGSPGEPESAGGTQPGDAVAGGPPAAPSEWRVERAELPALLDALLAERRRVQAVVRDLSAVPRLAASPPPPRAGEATVTLEADALALLTELASHGVPGDAMGTLPRGRTVDQLALERGLARTVRHLARLAELGLVSLDGPADEQPRPRAAQGPDLAPAHSRGLARTVSARRLLRPLVGFFLADAPAAEVAPAQSPAQGEGAGGLGAGAYSLLRT